MTIFLRLDKEEKGPCPTNIDTSFPSGTPAREKR